MFHYHFNAYNRKISKTAMHKYKQISTYRMGWSIFIGFLKHNGPNIPHTEIKMKTWFKNMQQLLNYLQEISELFSTDCS